MIGGDRGKGANETKKGNCTSVHSERTADWPYINGQGRKKWKEVGARGQ